MGYESNFKPESVLIIESELKCKRLAKMLDRTRLKAVIGKKSGSLYPTCQFD